MVKEHQEGSSREIVAVDIGGTHARFTIAKIAQGKVLEIGEPVTFKCAEFASLTEAWKAFAKLSERPVPKEAGIAVACPLLGDVLKLTNSAWTIRRSKLKEDLHLDDFILVNDFAAVAHSVANLESKYLNHLCGPEKDLPPVGSISLIGPGTGLGVALLSRLEGIPYEVIETEGGHIAFAPQDEVEDEFLKFVRRQGHRRVSTERIVSGPGLTNIYQALGHVRNKEASIKDNLELWKSALEDKDALAKEALDRFCLSFGSVSGDLALAHGSVGVVIAGGLGLRIADYLLDSGFTERFQNKGRFEKFMQCIPVKIITYPQPGLFGAAAAYANKL